MTARGAAGLCALAALALSLPTLRNQFAIDDAYLVVGNERIRSLRSVPGFFVQAWGGGAGGAEYARVNAAYYRPLTSTLQTLEYALFGLRPAGWHLTSGLLHAAAAGLGALLIARVAGEARAGLCGGLLFALHPVQTEAVAAACYQTTLLAGGLAAAALLWFGRGARVGPAALTAAALLAKEDAAVVPVLAAAWVLVARPASPRGAWTGVGAMALAAVLALLARAAVVGPSGVTYFGGAPRMTVVLTMLSVAGLYTQLVVAPVRLCPFYDWFVVPFQDQVSGAVLLGMGCVAALGAGLALALRRAPAVALGLSWIPLALLPVLHFVPILNVAAERFLYLPMLGVGLALGALVGPRRRASIGLALVLAALAARSLARLPAWHDDRTLNRATAREFPETPTPLLNLAVLDEAAGDFAAAERDLEEAARRAPGWPVPAQRLARLRAHQRRR